MNKQIELKNIDYAIFDRPLDAVSIAYKDDSVMMTTISKLSKKVLKFLESREKTDLDLEIEELGWNND